MHGMVSTAEWCCGVHGSALRALDGGAREDVGMDNDLEAKELMIDGWGKASALHRLSDTETIRNYYEKELK